MLPDSLLRDLVLLDRLRSELLVRSSLSPLLRGKVQDPERQSPAALQAVVDRFVLQPLQFSVLRTLCSIM